MTSLRPTGIKAPHGAHWFEVAWSDRTTRFPNRVLRGYCPCAGCQGHSGAVRFVANGSTELIDIQPVGNYGLQLAWGDTHKSGIYTFAYLRHLSQLLEEHGETLPEVLPELPRIEPEEPH